MRLIFVALVVSSLLALPTDVLAQSSPPVPFIVRPGGMCTPDQEERWERVSSEQEGAEAEHRRRHLASRLATARTLWVGRWGRDDNYLANDVENQTLCGEVVRDQRFYNDGVLRFLRWVPERDWNLYVRPIPEHQKLLLRPVPTPKPCTSKADLPDDDCIETEVTPDRELRAFLEPLPSLKGGPACAYGVHVLDLGHGGKPELHPTHAVWHRSTRGSAVRHRAYVVQDGSERFDKDSYFTPPYPLPWAGSPLELTYRVALRLADDRETNVVVASPVGRGLTTTHGSGGPDSGPIVLDTRTVGTLTVDNGFERFAQIEPTDFCRRGSEAIGFISVTTGVGGAEVGLPGYAVIDVWVGADRVELADAMNRPEAIRDGRRASLRLVPSSLRESPEGFIADYIVLQGASGPPLEGLMLVGAMADSGAVLEMEVEGEQEIFVVSAVPVRGLTGSAAGDTLGPMVSGIGESPVPLPDVGLRVQPEFFEAVLGEPDPATWSAFLNSVGVEAGPPPPGELSLRRVGEWRIHTLGSFEPVEFDEELRDVDFDLAYQANEVREEYLTRGGWTERWSESEASNRSEGGVLVFDGRSIVFDLSEIRGFRIWNLGELLPGYVDSMEGEVASHVVTGGVDNTLRYLGSLVGAEEDDLPALAGTDIVTEEGRSPDYVVRSSRGSDRWPHGGPRRCSWSRDVLKGEDAARSGGGGPRGPPDPRF